MFVGSRINPLKGIVPSYGVPILTVRWPGHKILRALVLDADYPGMKPVPWCGRGLKVAAHLQFALRV